jgi:hypothetical protein
MDASVRSTQLSSGAGVGVAGGGVAGMGVADGVGEALGVGEAVGDAVSVGETDGVAVGGVVAASGGVDSTHPATSEATSTTLTNGAARCRHGPSLTTASTWQGLQTCNPASVLTSCVEHG